MSVILPVCAWACAHAHECVCGCICVTAPMWRSRDNLCESVSFNHSIIRCKTQIIRLCNLAGPVIIILIVKLMGISLKSPRRHTLGMSSRAIKIAGREKTHPKEGYLIPWGSWLSIRVHHAPPPRGRRTMSSPLKPPVAPETFPP